MNIKEAISKVEKENEGFKVATALDTEKAWVFSLSGANGEELDIPPYAVNKETGKIDVFFPPEHMGELKTAKSIDLKEI